MKRLGKPVSIIIALLILVFSVVSLFGVNYYVGDNKNTVFKGFGNIDWGNDVNGGAEITLKCASSDEAVVDLKAAKKVIENRIVEFGLTDYQLYISPASEELVLKVPDSIDCEYSAMEIASMLTTQGRVTIRGGNSYSELIMDSSNNALFITPTGDTEKTILLESKDITASGWFVYQNSGTDYYYVSLTFNDEGTETLASVTDSATGSYYNKTVSVWLDDRMLSSPTVSETVDTGTLTFSGQAFTESKAKLYSAIISNGELPCKLSVTSLNETAPAVSNAADIVMIVGIIALVAIAVVLIIKYRLVGVVGLFALLSQFSAVVAVITRFVGDGHTFLLTVPGAAALAVSTLLPVISTVIFGERINSELRQGTVLGTAIPNAIISGRRAIVDISFTLAIVGVVGALIFGASGLSFVIFGGHAVSGIYNFCYVLIFGAVFNLVTGYLVPELMIRSLQSFNVFNKPSVFGGVK